LIEFGYPEKQIFIAYNGIELDGLEASRMDEKRRAEMKKNLGIENDKKILLFVGGLGADKNVKLLLRAAALLKESNPQQPFIMLIVGEGPQQKMLKDFVVANELKNEVKFLGRIVDGVDNYFQCCNCLVLPGAGGLSLTQAMYWEKPCIVAHADGTEEDLVKEGSTGFRFEPDNAQSLKKALLRFMNSSEDELLQMGKNGNTLIMQQSNVDKMLETFNKVISLLK
jgi:glycosyltransferase involved in cell wall biosynthesis